MPTGRKKTIDDGKAIITATGAVMNRSMTMEQVLMKNIMRLVVASSLIAIAANVWLMIG